MGLGDGANNFVELMALKLLLFFALEKDSRRIQIFGDSLVILNWVNKVQRRRNISLITLFEEVNKLMENFDYITCCHVYREINTDVDRLSKNGLTMEHGPWKFLETRDAEVHEFYHRPFIDMQIREDNF